jgi:hypothetical protein
MRRLGILIGMSIVLLAALACTGGGAAAPTPSAGTTPTPAGDVESGGIEGTVAGPSGGLVSGMRVAIVSGTASYPEIAPETDDDGNYRLSGIEPGTYEVAVFDSKGDTADSQSVVVKSGETATLDLTVPAGELPTLPVMRLLGGGNIDEGAEGSYCWPVEIADDGSVVGLCADKISWEALTTTLPVDPLAGATIEIEAGEPPDTLNASFFEVDSDASAGSVELEPGLEASLPVNLPAGVYNVRVSGFWDGDGDIAYEFRIEVASDTPATAAVLTGGLCLPATPLAVSAGASWTITGRVDVPDGFPSGLAEGAARMTSVFTLDEITTASYFEGDRSASAATPVPVEHPGVKVRLTNLVLDENGDTLSRIENSGQWAPAAVGNLGPVLTLDWACHREAWVEDWPEGAVPSVGERVLDSGVTAVVFSVRQPFVIPNVGIEAVLQRHHGYDKATGRLVLQETTAEGLMNGQPFTMEILQELEADGAASAPGGQAAPPLPEAPALVLEVTAGAQPGVPLSLQSGAAHVDNTGKSYPETAISPSLGELAVFKLAPGVRPRDLSLYVYPKGTSAGYFDHFPDSYLLREQVPVGTGLEAEIVLPPGQYEMVLRADLGSTQVNYGFVVSAPERFEVVAVLSPSGI